MHVQLPVVPPITPPLMQWKFPSLPLSVELIVATHASAVWQLAPLYPALHDVHLQLPVVPPIVPPLTQ
jgi:hypothetical protein